MILIVIYAGKGLGAGQMVENYLDYPSIVQIETTNMCNANCIFCANNLIKDKGIMEEDLYKNILKQCAEDFPQMGALLLIGTGEPLIDPNYIERLKLARKTLYCWILVYTNGSLLTDKVIEEMAKIEGLYLVISLNAASPETRKNLMGLSDYNYVLKQIKKAETAGIRIGVSMVDHQISIEEKIKFVDQWKHLPKTPHDGTEGLFILMEQNFAGTTYESAGSPYGYCFRTLYVMNILWNGIINMCCMDSQNEIILGDCNKNKLIEAWSSEKRLKLVNEQLWGNINKIKLCSRCTQPRETRLLRKHNIDVIKVL